MTLYFAYASNMANDQMAERCPQAKKISSARLLCYRWIIAADGYASVVLSPHDAVDGVLFEISSSDEAALDHFEEIKSGAYLKHNLPVQHEGKTSTALVYLNSVTGEGVASAEYSNRIRKGFADAGLSDSYVLRYISPFLHF